MIVSEITNKNDEWYTPRNAIYPILKYLKPNSTIWCPFDTENSEYVKLFRESGHKVIATHISNGENFFEVNCPKCDYIISNPPYSLKLEVFKRLFEIGKPFAMLVGVVGLFDSFGKAELFSENTFEIMYLNPRVKFINIDGNGKGQPPYQSAYVCSNILPKQICFERVLKDA